MRVPTPPAIAAFTIIAGIAGAVPQALAGERETATYQFETDVKVLSEQRTRGVSDSLMRPSVKLGMQLVHESGLVAVADIVRVSKKQFLGGDGVGVTLAGGYRFGDPEAWHFGAGMAAEFFPGAKFEAPHSFDMDTFTPGAMRSTRYDSGFALVEVGYGALEARLLDVVSKTYRGADTGGVCGAMLQFAVDPTAALACYARGDRNSRGSLLFDIDYKFALAPATTLTLHAGRQQVANFAEASFNDYRVSVTRKQWGMEWNADFVTTRTRARELYMVQDGDRVRATDNRRLVLSVSRRF
ncbi:hypothetical protein GJ700_01720 [Duganella sp. FT92W]|uniref:Porin n=1 Tax=Pseudoduganella rivuli TaxID=2666085 RepID=A0A7X2LPM4_9BURK|nr:TorF family putative porin [Pseudoduganella rivuli]MRV70440.1 hypothetical protein [Pseudoduganella rivuli]